MIIDIPVLIEKFEIIPGETKVDPGDPINSITTEDRIEVTDQVVSSIPVSVSDLITWVEIPESSELHIYINNGPSVEYSGDKESFEKLLLSTLIKNDLGLLSERESSWYFYLNKKYGDKIPGPSKKTFV